MQLYRTQSNVCAFFSLNYPVFSLIAQETCLRLFAIKFGCFNVWRTYNIFAPVCHWIKLFLALSHCKRVSPCLQLNTLISALCHSKRSFASFPLNYAVLNSARWKRLFACLLLLCCFYLSCTQPGFLACLQLIDCFELYLAQNNVFAVLLLHYAVFLHWVKVFACF